MKKIDLTLIIIMLVGIIFTNSCTDPIDNSQNVNELVVNAGRLEEPASFDPTIVGQPLVTTETNNDVQYKKTVTTYKMAKKFDSKTQADFSSKKDLKTDNDIYLGAIIQGKYWKENGDLISIGDFDRNNMVVTISGITINDGSNSIDAYPSNAEMTDAINSLRTTYDFVPNANNYKYINESASSQTQIGLSFGIHPAWMENIGFDFSIENTYQKNTVYVYFKQIYYTISAELPAQPSDFFTPDVDIEALKTKITSESPAGYISSIDYGRVIIVKMTSSSSKTDMKAAIGAVFNGLNIGVDGEYQRVLNNSKFEVDVYGGNSTTILDSISNVIEYINDGLVIQDLNSAVPIEYHVNYLDGGSFNTGDEIQYEEVNYEVTSASSMVIKKITFTQLPNLYPQYWDVNSDYPDVYPEIWNDFGVSLASYYDKYLNETTTQMLDDFEASWDTNLEITDFDAVYRIYAWDNDGGGNDDTSMGYVSFSVNENIINSGSFPVTKTLSNTVSGIGVVISLEWK